MRSNVIPLFRAVAILAFMLTRLPEFAGQPAASVSPRPEAPQTEIAIYAPCDEAGPSHARLQLAEETRLECARLGESI